MCTIEFRVTAKVRLGETIHLLGDAALGYFEPTESVQLSTTPDSYPVWRTTQALNFAPGHTLKYRCGSLCSVATVFAHNGGNEHRSYGGWLLVAGRAGPSYAGSAVWRMWLVWHWVGVGWHRDR